MDIDSEGDTEMVDANVSGEKSEENNNMDDAEPQQQNASDNEDESMSCINMADNENNQNNDDDAAVEAVGDLNILSEAATASEREEVMEVVTNGAVEWNNRIEAAIECDRQDHLMVSSVVLENFKSYGGRQVIGPFHRRFSSIVGPNGSGKSNIIDAMLFVFGRRAQQLRHKKLSDLIHRSASLPNLKFTKVSVYFQTVINDPTMAEQFVVKSRFVIAREAFVDGTSRYTIDGNTVAQKDVIALLKSKGVDLDHNRFLILQGEVEQIAMMKPKGEKPNEEGLLEYLEDIVGSNRYITEIEETKKELETVAELVQETREKMQAAKTQVESMKGPLQLAEQVCDTERKLLTLKTQLELKAGRTVNREVEKAQSAYDEMKTKWTDWKSMKSNEKKAIAELEAAAKKQREIVAKAEKLLKQADQEFGELERKDNELTASQTHCVKRAQALQKEAAKLETEKAKCETLAKELKERAEELHIEVPQLQSRTETLTAELEQLEKSLESEFSVLREQKEKADKDLQPQVVRLGTMQQAVEVMKTEARLIEEKQQAAREQQQRLQEKLKISQDKLTEKKTKLDEIQKNAEKLKKTFTKKNAEMIAMRDEFIKQRDDLQQLRQQLAMKESQYQESRACALVPRILQAKDDGTLQGVVDCLWNLGSITEDLTHAFSAVGGADVIVVEETEHAQRVVEFVRKLNLGRVTCIVLSRVKSELSKDLKELRRKEIPDGAKLLLDLVEVTDPEHEIAFYFVLRDTLLVSTLDEARVVAFGRNQRWKVVTMDGQLIDRSGTMTGGMSANKAAASMFKQVGGRKASAANETRDIEKLKISIAEKEGMLNSLKDKKARAEMDVSDLNQQMHDLDQQRVKLSAEVESAKQDVQHYKVPLESAEIPQLSKEEKQELSRLGKEYQKAEQEIAQQQEVVNGRQEEVDRITKAIEAVGGTKRRELKSELDAMTSKLEKLKKELKTDEVQSEVNRKKAKELEVTIPEKREEAEKELEAGRNYEKSKDQLTDEAEAVVLKKGEIEQALAEQREIEKEKLKLLKEKTEESKKAGLKEVEFQTTLQDIEQKLSGCKANLKKHQKQLKKYEEQFYAVPYILDIDKEASGSERQPRLELEMADQALDELDKVFVEVEIKKLTESMASVKVDLSILDKYRVAAEKLRERTQEFESACQRRETKAKELDQLEFLRLKQFSTGFVAIASAVKELYQMITQEGDAELELADPSNPFNGGIVFSVRPPNKSWKKIQNLSGGEKTLSSLALVFALHQYRPTPIYFLDEIDAALDYRNVSTIALYVANQAKDVQFVIISLRNHMFELADRLVGIYKTHGKTKSVTIDPDDLVNDEQKGAMRELEDHDNNNENEYGGGM